MFYNQSTQIRRADFQNSPYSIFCPTLSDIGDVGVFVFNREIRVKPFRTKFTNILTGLGVTAALPFSIPSSAVSQETALPGKGEVVLEKAGEIELGDLIQQWASEMDHVYAETRIQAKDTNKKIFERLGINDKAFVRYVNSIKGKENPLLASRQDV